MLDRAAAFIREGRVGLLEIHGVAKQLQGKSDG
jgi:hypothetical protein